MNSQKVESYYENNISSSEKGKYNKKDRIISNFIIDKKGDLTKNNGANDCGKNDNNEKDAILELKDDLLFEPFVDEKILNDILDENDPQLEMGYKHFMENVFNKNSLKTELFIIIYLLQLKDL